MRWQDFGKKILSEGGRDFCISRRIEPIESNIRLFAVIHNLYYRNINYNYWKLSKDHPDLWEEYDQDLQDYLAR